MVHLQVLNFSHHNTLNHQCNIYNFMILLTKHLQQIYCYSVSLPKKLHDSIVALKNKELIERYVQYLHIH